MEKTHKLVPCLRAHQHFKSLLTVCIATAHLKKSNLYLSSGCLKEMQPSAGSSVSWSPLKPTSKINAAAWTRVSGSSDYSEEAVSWIRANLT